MVPKASAIKARLARGSVPSRRKPPSSQTPTKVPTLAKRSTEQQTTTSSPKPSFGEGEEKKEEAGKKDDAESGLPGHAAAENDGVGEVGVEGHTGRESDGIVGPQSHDERGDRGRNASGKENAVDGHARLREDARV